MDLKLILENSVIGQISESYIVDNNPCIIESIEIKKIKSKVHRFKNQKEYSLPTHTYYTDSIIEEINLEFIDFLKNNSNLKSDIKYFNRGILKNFFVRKNPEDLIDKISNISDYSWIITSDDISDEISKIRGFIKSNLDSNFLIKEVGKIGNVLVYSTDMIYDCMFMGSFDSLSSIISRNIISNLNDTSIEYLFIKKNTIDRIDVI